MAISRRSFLKGTAALFAAPAIIKAENLMDVWTPPEPEIFTGYSKPAIIEDYRDALTTLTVGGLRRGTLVALVDARSGRVIGTEAVQGSEVLFNLTGAQQRDVVVRAQMPGVLPVEARMTLPFGQERHHMTFSRDTVIEALNYYS